MELLEKIVKRFKEIFAITSILDVRLGLNTPLKNIFSGNTQKSNLRQIFLQSYRQYGPTFNETGLPQRENLRENVIAKASF